MKRKYSLLVIALLVLSLMATLAFTTVAETSDEQTNTSEANPLEGIKTSLTLYSDFTINFFIPKEDCLLTKVTANGKVYNLNSNTPTYTTDGVEYYKLTVTGIAADKAADDFTILFEGEGYSETKNFSVIRYCDILLSNSQHKSSFTLAASVVSYINTAYDYSNAEKSELLLTLLASDKYTSYIPETMPAVDTATNVGTVGEALSGAQLNLGSNLKFRFNLKPSFSGTLTLGGSAYNITNGVSSDKTYIELSVSAYDMYDPEKCIKISGASTAGKEFSGTYDLRAYIGGMDKNDTELTSLLYALYTYCAEAYSYKHSKTVDRPELEYKLSSDGTYYTVTGIGEYPDSYVVIPSEYKGLPVKSINSGAFMSNTKIVSVVIPDSVTNIGNNAFRGCTSLKNVQMSDSVTVIGQYAFMNTAQKNITLSDSLKSIGLGAYKGTSPESITLPFLGGSRESSRTHLGFIFGASDYAASEQYVPKTLLEVILSGACEEIPAFAFYGCSNIENVVIGEGVTKIGNSAFRGCTSLTSIYIPANVVSIPANAYTYNSPFYETSESFLIVLEGTPTSGFGKYWAMTASDAQAIIAAGYTYEEYLMNKEEIRNPDPTDASLNALMLDGVPIDGFSPDVFEYSVSVDISKGYPKATVLTGSHTANYVIVQASSKTGGRTTVTVTSGDGTVSNIYTVTFSVTGTLSTNSEVVNKDGANGVVSFIFDDGHQPTATALKQLMAENEYKNIKFTFAIKTQDFATFTDKYGNRLDAWGNATDANGNLIGKNGEVIANMGSFTIDKNTGCPMVDGMLITDQKADYAIDEDGNYSFVENDANVAFWRDILSSTNNSEIISHTHTSAFWGLHDNGGEQFYLNQARDEILSKVMPKNSVHKEVYGSKQIIEELFSEYIFGGKHISLGRPGLTDCNKVVASFNGVTYDTCYTHFELLMAEAIANGDYCFERVSSKKIVRPSDLATIAKRALISSYVAKSEDLGANAENGIAFINEALSAGGWANFSFHCIDTGWHTTTSAEMKSLLDYAESLGERVWVASFTEAAMYYAEWSTASVSTSYDESAAAVSVNLTDKENDTLYVMPLTVKVYVPGTWESAQMNGEALEIHRDESGNAFVYANIIPDSGVKTITEAN